MNKNPKISVVMANYNGAEYIKETIDSILSQEFSNFEFIIIDDCSKDNSNQIISSYNDSRIVLIKNGQNLGLAASLNKGLDASRGEYFARIDSDDIALPKRFKAQAEFMDKNPDIDICGSFCAVFGGSNFGIIKRPYKYEDLLCFNLFQQGFFHPSIMVRKKSFTDNDIRYDDSYRYAEDYELFTRCEEKGLKFINIPEVLVLYRTHSKQMTEGNIEKQNKFVIPTVAKRLRRFMPQATDEQVKTHHSISFGHFKGSRENYKQMHEWFKTIQQHNKNTSFYNHHSLLQAISDLWIQTKDRLPDAKPWAWYYFLTAPFCLSYKLKTLYKRYPDKILTKIYTIIKFKSCILKYQK